MSNITIFGWGPLPWNDVILLVWFTLTALSVIYVVWDAFTNNPEMTISRTTRPMIMSRKKAPAA